LWQPPGAALAAALAALEPTADRDGSPGAPGFLAALARVVLPGLLAAYRAYGELLVAVADAPAARALTLVLRDETDELEALERLAGAPTGAVGIAGERGSPDAARGFFPWSAP
ncbi:MAG: hypothetical protein ACRDWE_12210, partial [Acidimicrobiales bacterium]